MCAYNVYRNLITKLKRNSRISFSSEMLRKQLPEKPGIYAISHRNGRIVYIGKAGNIRQRLYNNLLMGQLRSHTLSKKLQEKYGLRNKSAVKNHLRSRFYFAFVVKKHAKERNFLEHAAIACLRPKMND